MPVRWGAGTYKTQSRGLAVTQMCSEEVEWLCGAAVGSVMSCLCGHAHTGGRVGGPLVA